MDLFSLFSDLRSPVLLFYLSYQHVPPAALTTPVGIDYLFVFVFPTS